MQEQSAALPLVEVRELSVAYSPRGGTSKTVADVKAVDNVSFALAKGECLGLSASLVRESRPSPEPSSEWPPARASSFSKESIFSSCRERP